MCRKGLPNSRPITLRLHVGNPLGFSAIGRFRIATPRQCDLTANVQNGATIQMAVRPLDRLSCLEKGMPA